MEASELEKIKEYRDLCEQYYDSNDNYGPDGFLDEINDFANKLKFKYDWTIQADDTHRWVECDGFYEVEFMLYICEDEKDGDVYINTESGGRDLEDEWSSSNPQDCPTFDYCYMDDTWDWYYFLDGLYKFYTGETSSED